MATARTVLLVEDNEINQEVAAAMLRRSGYRVDVAENGRAAIDAVARKDYDAVLMDCQMPVMDGYAATAELRRRECDGAHLPIIALTAHALDGERERCLAAGMDDFLAKPVRADELTAALARHLEPPVVDPDATTRLEEAVGSAELVAQIVEMFLAQAAGHVEAIAQADDHDTVHRVAHTLKGSATTVGAIGIAREAEALERGAGDPDRLRTAFERTRAQLAPR